MKAKRLTEPTERPVRSFGPREVPRKRATPLPGGSGHNCMTSQRESASGTVGEAGRASVRPAACAHVACTQPARQRGVCGSHYRALMGEGRPACLPHVDLFDRAADAATKPGYRPPVYDACLAVCRTCPVLETCRDWALRNEGELRFGVVGGMTPLERARAGRSA